MENTVQEGVEFYHRFHATTIGFGCYLGQSVTRFGGVWVLCKSSQIIWIACPSICLGRRVLQ